MTDYRHEATTAAMSAAAQRAVERMRQPARIAALNAAVELELGMAGDAISQGLSAEEAAHARAVVEQTAARFETWLMREPE